MNRKVSIIGLIGLVVIGVLLYRGQALSRELAQVRAETAALTQSTETLNFLNLFVDKVLLSETEIDFETRLELENAVRELQDEEILTKWRAFVDSSGEAAAQEAVKKLLATLAHKAGGK